MDSTKRLRYVLETIETLPEGFIQDLNSSLENDCEELLGSIRSSIQSRICNDLKDFTGDQFQSLFSCMAGSPSKHEVRQCLIENRHNMRDSSPLENLCHGKAEPEDELASLSTLKRLRELDLFRKQDIIEMGLIRQGCLVNYCTLEHVNGFIFHCLVEWDPTALKHAYDRDWPEFTPLQLRIHDIYCDHQVETVKMIIKAGLKYFPNELGLLTYDYDNSGTPFADVMDTDIQTQRIGWTIIVDCLEEVEDFKLHEPDPSTNLYLFMFAASEQTCSHVDLTYYLLRRDPSVLLHFNLSTEGFEGVCRNRKRM